MDYTFHKSIPTEVLQQIIPSKTQNTHIHSTSIEYTLGVSLILAMFTLYIHNITHQTFITSKRDCNSKQLLTRQPVELTDLDLQIDDRLVQSDCLSVRLCRKSFNGVGTETPNHFDSLSSTFITHCSWRLIAFTFSRVKN